MARCWPNFCNRSNRKKRFHFNTNVSMKSRPFDRPAWVRTFNFLVRMRSLQKLPLILPNFVTLRSIADAFTYPSSPISISGIPAVQDQTCFFGKDGYSRSEEHTSELQSHSDLVC